MCQVHLQALCAGSLNLCEGGGGDNRRYRISKKKEVSKGQRNGSQSGPCRFTYFNGSSCISDPREICLSFFHFDPSSLLLSM